MSGPLERPVLGPGPYADPTGHRVAELMIKYAAPDELLRSPAADIVSRPEVRVGYADDGRKYPVHTPAASWVSAAAYHDSASNDTKVAAVIQSSCRYHGIGSEWDRIERVARSVNAKRAAHAAPKAYALTDPNRYPIDTAENVAAAVDYFMKYADEFTDSDRRTFARSTIKAASDLGTYDSVPDAAVYALESEAGFGRLAKNWKSEYAVRAKLASDPARGDAKLAVILNRAVTEAPNDPAAAAADLRRLDKLAGWVLPRPALVDTTPTLAARKLAAVVESVTGSYYDRAQLTKAAREVTDDVLRDVVGLPDPLPLVSGAAVIDALVRGSVKVATAVETVLADLGVRPVSVTRKRVDWVALAG